MCKIKWDILKRDFSFKSKFYKSYWVKGMEGIFKTMPSVVIHVGFMGPSKPILCWILKWK